MSIFLGGESKKEKKEPKNLKEILDILADLEGKMEKMSLDLKKMKENAKLPVQKTAIVRFNPFSGVGGEQSFSLALLDGNDDGVVITSLYTRTDNRVYGKPIKNGQSEYVLSEEEKQAIEKAKGSK
jgi:hypothetical protein